MGQQHCLKVIILGIEFIKEQIFWFKGQKGVNSRP
jgi:hypothetical protein